MISFPEKKNGVLLIIPYLFLAIPFVIVLIYTKGLTQGLDTIFSIDEPMYHYPTILNFANQLPFPNIRNYDSATTPLFHILMAVFSKLTGSNIRYLRLVNFFITYIAVLLLFFVLVKRVKLNTTYSLLFSMLFALSPYFFREAFVVLTDNLPIVWLLCFFNFYFKYKEDQKQKWFLLAMLFVMLLCFTRQTYLFLCLAISIDVIAGEKPIKKKVKNLWLIFVAAIPTLVLFIIWKGLTPPTFQEYHTRTSFFNTKAVFYGVSVLGFYSIFISGWDLCKSVFQQKKVLVIGYVLLTWLALFLFPLVKHRGDFGYLWYVAEPLPYIAGTSLLFWLLLPLGAICLLGIWNKDGYSFLFFFLLCLFLSEMPNNLIFQRYYDSSILLVLIFFNARYHESNKIDFYRRMALIIFFIAYFVMFTVA